MGGDWNFMGPGEANVDVETFSEGDSSAGTRPGQATFAPILANMTDLSPTDDHTHFHRASVSTNRIDRIYTTLAGWQLVCVDGTQQGGRTNCGPLTLGSNGGVHLHVIVDHSLVELIANNITAITASVAPSASAAGAARYGGGAADGWQLAADS